MSAALDWRTAPVPFIAGLSDTRKDGPAPYEVRPLGEIVSTAAPYRLPKNRAFAFLPSLYAANDARSHTAQRERGQFVALVGDIDEGDHPLVLIDAAIEKLAPGVARSIYSTASAAPDSRRWRIIIPLAGAVAYEEWREAQLALVDHMASEGIALDTCAARPGQISYLPNVPEDARAPDGEPRFFECAASQLTAPGLEIGTGVTAQLIHEMRERRARDDAERERIKAEAFARRARKPISAGDGGSMIEAFNRDNAVSSLLERYGYKRSPRHGEDWRSPLQTSDSFATRVIEGDKWISLSGSDAAAGLGERCAAGCFGDAFDLFAHFEHGGDRKAALRELHRDREASFASGYAPSTGEVFGNQGERPHGSTTHMREGFDPISGDTIEPPPPLEPIPTLDLAALSKIKARPKRFAIERLAPAGEVTLFTGAGSAGKSLLSQQLATAAAAGKATLGFQIERMPALYLTCEDDEGQLHWRQEHISAALGAPMRDLAGMLHLGSLRGELGSELATFGQDSTLKPTKAYKRLVATLQATGARIAFLDNVAHLFTGNENDRHQVAAFLNLLNRLAGETDTAIMLLGHPNKSGDTYSGSTAWINQVRSHCEMEHDIETDMRTLRLGKSNYARKGDEVRFFWQDWAFVGEDDLPPNRAREFAEIERALKDGERFLECLAETTRQKRAVSESPNAANYAPKVFVRMPEAKGIGLPRLTAAMERLFRIDKIARAEVWKGPDRKSVYGLREGSAEDQAK